MIKVLNVISALNNAGTEAVVMNYYRNMDRSKIQFDFLVLDMKEGYYEKEIQALGGKVFKIPSMSQNPLSCMKQRRKFFRENRYDIVEVHSPSALRYAYCKLAKKSGVKAVIFHIHSFDQSDNFIIRYARKQIKKYCDQTVTCSQAAAESVLGQRADKLIPNAISYNLYQFDPLKRETLRNFYGICENEKIIGHIGRFSAEKNQLFLLQVFEEVVKKRADLKLILKGFGAMKEQVLLEIQKRNLKDRVIIASDDHSACDLYNAFDLFVLPSTSEGLGIVAIEAQANGLNVLASCNVPQEANILGKVRFVDLNLNEWENNLCDSNFYKRSIVNLESFSKTGYEIKSAADSRGLDYLNMVERHE